VYTNTTQVDAYRGAGRPEAILTLERRWMMPRACWGWTLSPCGSAISSVPFPYRTVGELYDVGDFPRVLNRLQAEADVAGFAARRKESAARGMLRGMGLSCYIEAILGDPDEAARVDFTDGGVTLRRHAVERAGA
jgi:aerobic carbon-monoxide dehydrogenase large subunit